MTASGNMTHRGKLQRNTASGTDSFNHPVKPNYTALATIPCRVSSKMRTHVIDNNKTVHVEDIRGRCEKAEDILEGDQFEQIEDRAGTIIFAGPLKIVSIIERRWHKELILERFVP